jgi:hypothetical protein
LKGFQPQKGEKNPQGFEREELRFAEFHERSNQSGQEAGRVVFVTFLRLFAAKNLWVVRFWNAGVAPVLRIA